MFLQFASHIFKTLFEEIMRELASQACAESYLTDQNRACVRQGTRRNEKDDPYSIDAGILGVLAQAEKIETGVQFNQNVLDENFILKVVYLNG